MRVNRLLPRHGMPSGFSTALGPKAENHRDGSLRLLPARAGNIAENAGACRVERRVRLDALMQDPILHWVKKAMAALGVGYKNEW